MEQRPGYHRRRPVGTLFDLALVVCAAKTAGSGPQRRGMLLAAAWRPSPFAISARTSAEFHHQSGHVVLCNTAILEPAETIGGFVI
jgi:hypothetical protein